MKGKGERTIDILNLMKVVNNQEHPTAEVAASEQMKGHFTEGTGWIFIHIIVQMVNRDLKMLIPACERQPLKGPA